MASSPAASSPKDAHSALPPTVPSHNANNGSGSGTPPTVPASPERPRAHSAANLGVRKSPPGSMGNVNDRIATQPPLSHSSSGLDTTSMASRSSAVSTSRVERLLQERQLRRNRSSGLLASDSEDTGSEVDFTAGTGSSTRGSRYRLIIVANRLPVSATRGPDGSWSLRDSVSGLVAGLRGAEKNYDVTWVGWPGMHVTSDADKSTLGEALNGRRYHPVYLDENLVELYYNGYCNSVLWQLFHYVTLPLETRLDGTQTMKHQWNAYMTANVKFAEEVLRVYREGDIVWCHDYHLMLLPSLLKERVPGMKLGWFLHTPFPSSEIYRTLPQREAVLRGVLSADLVGFHTYDYARHFVSACTRILGLEGTPEGVEDRGSATRVAAFPIGIDPEHFTSALNKPEVRKQIDVLKTRFAGKKVMLGVDRLDPIKGIPQKLLAFEKFLLERPQWRDQVLLVQIAVPTRTHVAEYQKLRSLVHEIVGRINGRFGTIGSVPIHHLDREMGIDELCALYAVTDVALITSLRDGMNLVSYEFVAAQIDQKGVLVLSEFAGAAQSLGAGAILVNPWNIGEMALAIEDALSMPEKEKTERHRNNMNHIKTHTSAAWADNFISELNDTHVEAELRRLKIPPMMSTDVAVNAFAKSNFRLLVFGFNATLTQKVEKTGMLANRSIDHTREVKKVSPEMKAFLRRLAENPRTIVVIFSGSERKRLEEVFGDLPVWLSAENGVFIRTPPNHPALTNVFSVSQVVGRKSHESGNLGRSSFERSLRRAKGDDNSQRGGNSASAALKTAEKAAVEQKTSIKEHEATKGGAERSPLGGSPTKEAAAADGANVESKELELSSGWSTTVDSAYNMDWFESVRLVYEYFTERTPRSFVEARETSLVWNYRYADQEFGRLQARDMLQHLWTGPISNAAVDIVQGLRSVEVRPMGVSKGAAIDRIISSLQVEEKVGKDTFVLCAGHFLGRDEDLFAYFESKCAGGTKYGDVPVPSPLAAETHPLRSTLSSQEILHNTISEGQVIRDFGFSNDTSGEDLTSAASLQRSQSARRDLESDSGITYICSENSLFTCTVGRKRSHARYYLDDSDAVKNVLKRLVSVVQAEETAEAR